MRNPVFGDMVLKTEDIALGAYSGEVEQPFRPT